MAAFRFSVPMTPTPIKPIEIFSLAATIFAAVTETPAAAFRKSRRADELLCIGSLYRSVKSARRPRQVSLARPLRFARAARRRVQSLLAQGVLHSFQGDAGGRQGF